MDNEVISILTTEKGLGELLKTVKSIQYKNQFLTIGSPNYGQLSDKMIVTYKVKKSDFKRVVELFTLNNIPISTKDEYTLSIINAIRKTSGSSSADPYGKSGQNDSSDRRGGVGEDELDSLVKAGNYQEIIKLSKDISNRGTDIAGKIKNALTEAVQNAINRAFEKGQSSQIRSEECIDELIKIASDQNLKNLNKIEMIKQAGNCVIDLCVQYPKHAEKLVAVGNINGIPPIVNLKAAAKFSEIVFADDKKFAEDIAIAVRSLNTKWLSIAADLAEHDLTVGERSDFNRLLLYIKKNR